MVNVVSLGHVFFNNIIHGLSSMAQGVRPVRDSRPQFTTSEPCFQLFQRLAAMRDPILPKVSR